MIQPWKKIKDEPYKAGYRKMVKRTFEMPNGKLSDFDLISGGNVVCILSLTKENKVILAREFRPAQERLLLELPGGAVDEGEEPEEAAKRELLEETGYIGEFQFIGTSLQSAYNILTRYNFVALNCEKIQEPTNFECEESEPYEMTLEEFRAHLQSGDLTDVTTGYLGLDYLKLL
ncbi:MAG TPA: NUDIX hydrolase [bacterium]|nr:NUDIX hydrolase [bacterium]